MDPINQGQGNASGTQSGSGIFGSSVNTQNVAGGGQLEGSPAGTAVPVGAAPISTPVSTPISSGTGDIVLSAEPEKKGKRGLIIGVILVFVAVLVGALLVVKNMINETYHDGMTKEEVNTVLTSERINLIGKFEKAIENAAAEPLLMQNVFNIQDERMLEEIGDGLVIYKDVYEKLSSYEAVQYLPETAEYFSTIKERMARMLPEYETVIERYRLLHAFIYDDADVKTISDLSGFDNAIVDGLANYRELLVINQEYKQMNCSIEERTTVGTNCYNLKAKIRELERVSMVESGFDLRKILFPNGVSIFIDEEGLVRGTLSLIEYSVNGSSDTLEDE